MNWGMRVLQTLALPLGYVTVWKKEQRLRKNPYISALCGFSYCKNYNTKNSVCKALKNANPCRYPKRLPARRGRCRRNGHDFFVLQNVNSALSKTVVFSRSISTLQVYRRPRGDSFFSQLHRKAQELYQYLRDAGAALFSYMPLLYF